MRITETDGRVTVQVDRIRKVETVKKPDFSTPPVPREAVVVTCENGVRLELVMPPGSLKLLQAALK